MLLPLQIRLGDAYWAMDSLEQAKQQYEFLEAVNLNGWYGELCALRLESLKSPQEVGELKIYFIYSLEDTVRIARLERLKSPIARYLLSREYAAKERFVESTQVLEKLGSMESKTLEFFRLRRMGMNYFQLKDYEKAQTAFKLALPIMPNESMQIEIRDWIAQCEFFVK